MQTSAIKYENKINFTKWPLNRLGTFLEFINSIMVLLKYKCVKGSVATQNVVTLQNVVITTFCLATALTFWVATGVLF